MQSLYVKHFTKSFCHNKWNVHFFLPGFDTGEWKPDRIGCIIVHMRVALPYIEPFESVVLVKQLLT